MILLVAFCTSAVLSLRAWPGCCCLSPCAEGEPGGNLRAGAPLLGYSPEPGEMVTHPWKEPILVLKIQRRKEAEQQHDVCLLGA